MLERITEDTKLVMDAGVAAARQLGHAYLGTEHILIGMVRAPGCTAHGILVELGVSLQGLEADVLAILKPDKRPVEDARLPLTPRAIRVVELACEHAHRWNRGSLAPEHLLLALLQERENIAAGVLRGRGVETEVVYDLVEAGAGR